jgi:Holliday junction resolvase
MWDEESMLEKLREAGFTAIRRCAFNDGEDLRFREVEAPDRFEGCLAIECKKS